MDKLWYIHTTGYQVETKINRYVVHSVNKSHSKLLSKKFDPNSQNRQIFFYGVRKCLPLNEGQY